MNRSAGSVVIIEDDRSVQESIIAVLQFGGWDLTYFLSAEEFLESERPAGPVCIVADVRLPGMSGIELLDRLSKNGSQFGFVIISGHGDPELVHRLSTLERVWFLEKPFEPERLVDCVSDALRV